MFAHFFHSTFACQYHDGFENDVGFGLTIAKLTTTIAEQSKTSIGLGLDGLELEVDEVIAGSA